jgi:hypothetical protein
VSKRESENARHTQSNSSPRITKTPLADISAEERFYSRSLKIRLGVMECLMKLAEHEAPGNELPWESFEDLAGYCANYVFTSRWDRKPASVVTAARWCKQFFLGNGLFKPVPRGSGGFSISFRGAASKLAILSLLKQYRPKRRPPEKPQPRPSESSKEV